MSRYLQSKIIRRYFTVSRSLSNNSSIIHENGLYYGKFSKEEYEHAAQYVKENIAKLESEIKGDHNIRENIGKMPMVPSIHSKHTPRLDNLTVFLEETIKTTGPLPLSAFMRQCLTHLQFGYYTTRNPLDKESGDFITSPEISSVFGEMIGIWLFSTWTNQGKPSRINIVEFGPGKGTLMHDCLKSFNKLNKGSINPGDISVTMIEASPVLRKLQHTLLCGNNSSTVQDDNNMHSSTTIWNNKISWVETENFLKNEPGVANYILAHEFFDALPIKSFVRTENGWRELLVEHSDSVINSQLGLPGSADSSKLHSELLKTHFHLTMSPSETNSSIIPSLNPRYKNLPVGSRIEISPDTELYALKIAQLLNNEKQYGSALIIDYGPSNSIPDNTLRGIYKHKLVSPFFKPGEVDLSADVDFMNIKKLVENACDVYGAKCQGDWLHDLGIGYRIQSLLDMNSSNPEKQDKIYESYLRLTNKDENSMGAAYKFLCLMPLNSKPPVGFGGSI